MSDARKIVSQTHEEKMRDKYPAMKDAWERYEVVKKMCMAGEPAPRSAAEDMLAQIRGRMK